MIEIRKSNERGVAELGWLSSRHTFSFGHYRDPRQQGFSDLLVINDDRVMPGQGFGRHSHRDMEIFSYVLEGALEHQDTMGTDAVIRPGDVQMMSAGSGIAHSEYNHSTTEPIHFLQIWIVPYRTGVTPRYHQLHFPTASKHGQLRLIISPQGEAGSLNVYLDARVYAGLFDAGESAVLALGPERYAYIHVARGTVTINGAALSEGDSARLRGEPKVTVDAGRGAEVLVFDLRALELPKVAR